MKEIIECALCGKEVEKSSSHCTELAFEKDRIGDPSADFYCSEECFNEMFD